MTAVELSSARELLGTPAVVPPLPLGQITMVLTPVTCEMVMVMVDPAGMVRSAALFNVHGVSVGTVVLLLGVTDSVYVAFSPPALAVSVMVTLRAPVPPLREVHSRTEMLPAGRVSVCCRAGDNTQVTLTPDASASLVSAPLGRKRCSERVPPA